ncbi:HEAT repeat domain-containing protein [Myxococcota bacterium]|nr:HEAT repeat domain-containing protein [Myxococcota bacterium]
MKHKRNARNTRSPHQPHQDINFELGASGLCHEGQIYKEQHNHWEMYYYSACGCGCCANRYDYVPPPPAYAIEAIPSALLPFLQLPPERISESLDLPSFDVWDLVPFFHEFTRRFPHSIFSLRLLESILSRTPEEQREQVARACRAAIRRLRLRSADAIPHLTTILDLLLPTFEQRSLLFAIATMGTLAAPLLPRLYQFASAYDIELCAQAAHTLSLLGPRDPLVLQCLQRILQRPLNPYSNSGQPHPQLGALLALDRMGEMARQILHDVQALSLNDHPALIKAWTRIIGKFQHNPNTNIPRLERWLHHDDPSVQETVVMALGKFGHHAATPNVFQHLLLFITQPKQQRRHEASLRTLAKICRPPQIPALCTALQQHLQSAPTDLFDLPLLQHPPHHREQIAFFFHTLAAILRILSDLSRRNKGCSFPYSPTALSLLCSFAQRLQGPHVLLWKSLFSTQPTASYEMILRSLLDFLDAVPTSPDPRLHKEFEEALFS